MQKIALKNLEYCITSNIYWQAFFFEETKNKK